ncbi:MAG: SUMF1/EgtB/PvdO family nonheme iron enzyme [Planctomycetota bacterium]
MRPDLTRDRPPPEAPIGSTHRLLAVGGFLGFVALLLLVLQTGLRLFSGASGPAVEPAARIEPTSVVFAHEDGARIASGTVAWGTYRPSGVTAPLLPMLRGMPEEDKPDDAAYEELREWAEQLGEAVRELSRAQLPDIYRVDDPFRISPTEVTQSQWFAFLVARAERSGIATPASYIPAEWRRKSGVPLVPEGYSARRGGHPVTGVSFVAALEFCNWIWEELLDSDPNLVVDLPTALEFTLTGRGSSYDNVPPDFNIGDRLVDVGTLPGRGHASQPIYGLLGNAAEWIHFGTAASWDESTTGCAVAGWSFRDTGRRLDESPSPFSSEGLERDFTTTDRARHVGFRFVVRRAPPRPTFVHVEAGPVQSLPRANSITELNERDPLAIPEGERHVAAPFRITVHEITNRQYLAFLTSVQETGGLQPAGFKYRPHPHAGHEVVYRGPFGDPDRVPMLFEPGAENQPVQGVTPAQAQAYARWLGDGMRLPTAAEFVRAGRGDRAEPYPWGRATGEPELVCAGRADDFDRAVSTRRFFEGEPTRPIALCGNAMEIVRAPGEDDVFWLAGGCYEFEPDACTLDSFLALEPRTVNVPLDLEEEPDAEQPELRRSLSVYLRNVTGFRVVDGSGGR